MNREIEERSITISSHPELTLPAYSLVVQARNYGLRAHRISPDAAIGNLDDLAKLTDSVYHIHLATNRPGSVEDECPWYVRKSSELRRTIRSPVLYVVGPADYGLLSNMCDKYLVTQDILASASKLLVDLARVAPATQFLKKP